jgi:hypothetical protein
MKVVRLSALRTGRLFPQETSFFFFFFFFFYGATARGGPWPPFQSASKHLDPLLYLSIRLFPSFSGP